MRVKVLPGKYILAVSGGVDSMSLMHYLARRRPAELVVAHFNHGIRPDAAEDEQLVREVSHKYGLAAEFGRAKLGPDASEEKARAARYRFLEQARQKHSADAIITAHHQDDFIETAFLNLLRGTGRRGLGAIASSEIVRPLIDVPKSEILAYARKNKLVWREDDTNRDEKYSRNYLRKALAGMTEADRKLIMDNLTRTVQTNKNIDQEIATLSHNIKSDGVIDRGKFINLPSKINQELIMYWLRELGVLDYDRKTVNRLGEALRTAKPETRHEAIQSVRLDVGKKTARFVTTD